jgi:hypothetical protein
MQSKFLIQNIIGYEVFKTQTAAQQVIGREGETATFLFSLLVKFGVGCSWFHPTSSQELKVFDNTNRADYL